MRRRRWNSYGYRKTPSRGYRDPAGPKCASCGRPLGNCRAVQQEDGTWICSDCERYGPHHD